jgi:hypothetical protein
MRTENQDRIKEFWIDVLVKLMQIVFAAMVVGPFVSGKFDYLLFVTGLIACMLCLIVGRKIASLIKAKEAL